MYMYLHIYIHYYYTYIWQEELGQNVGGGGVDSAAGDGVGGGGYCGAPVGWEVEQLDRHLIFLLYQYKRTNTDAEAVKKCKYWRRSSTKVQILTQKLGRDSAAVLLTNFAGAAVAEL